MARPPRMSEDPQLKPIKVRHGSVGVEFDLGRVAQGGLAQVVHYDQNGDTTTMWVNSLHLLGVLTKITGEMHRQLDVIQRSVLDEAAG